MESISARLLQRAAELVGGRDVLCHELQVPRAELDRFIAGTRTVPTSLFLRLTDLVLEESAALCEPSHKHKAPTPSIATTPPRVAR